MIILSNRTRKLKMLDLDLSPNEFLAYLIGHWHKFRIEPGCWIHFYVAKLFRWILNGLWSIRIAFEFVKSRWSDYWSHQIFSLICILRDLGETWGVCDIQAAVGQTGVHIKNQFLLTLYLSKPFKCVSVK